MAGLINIGLSGLLAHQSALATTGNNVANANTPGYSRQATIFDSLPSQYSGAGYVGAGVSVADIQRLNNEFINQQLRSDTALNGSQSVLAKELGRLDNLFGTDATGLNSIMTGFFSALQDAAESPDSIPQRQLLISRGEALAQRFQSLSARLSEHGVSIEQQIAAETSKINSMAKAIAELNLAISSSPGLAQGLQPNELLDKRDEMLRQLAESVPIQVLPQANGQVDVYLANGQTLVGGGRASTLNLQADPENPRQNSVILTTGVSTRRVDDEIGGGRLGGLLEFRESVLDTAQRTLGRIAIGVAEAINQQHQKGIDLEGNLGGLFFADINSATAMANRVTASAGNTGTGALGVEIGDLAQLSTEDYVIEFTSTTDYVVKRADGEGTPLAGTLTGPPPAPIALPGFNIEVVAGGFQAGDRFRLSPTGTGAEDIAMRISRPEAIALASPLQAETNLANTGSGAIDQGTVLDITGPGFNANGQPDPPLQIRFTGPTGYEVIDTVTSTVLFTGTYTPGQPNEIFPQAATDPDYRGFQYVVSGNPEAGDTFTIGFNQGNSSDNRNGLVLGQIAGGGLFDGGTTSPADAYGLLVGDIGIETSRAQRSQNASETLLSQSSARWQAQSGVNLDEEAGRLIQYQAAYRASAQVISVARDLFDTLLGTFR